MRAGASCAVQQTLTSEAASVLKHSLSLARRRGHAQVTPLHVAAILLSSRVSLLRRACLKSQPHYQSSHHPLQCRALELCFNVALNRLPTTPAPLLHAGQPSLSNALIAALKRAQAHQRRGCIEQQQQQPLLAIKVELEQLILSILDDPSVSRVMREAGFSSTAVKNNLELDSASSSAVSSVFQCYSNSGGIYSTPSSPPNNTESSQKEQTLFNNISINPSSFSWHSHQFLQNPLLFSPQKRVFSNNNPILAANTASVNKEDIKLVIEVLLGKKRRNTVIIGDSVSITEGLVAELMGKVEKGDVPEELKSVHFIKFQFTAAPLKFMKKEEVELNISDLRRKVESLVSSGGGKGGVVVYTGDLKWTVDDSSPNSCERVVEGDSLSSINEVPAGGYSPVDHLVAEIGRLVSFYSSSNTRLWLIATANYQTYMRCQMKNPPLDIQWALQSVSVPSGGLGLSLNATSIHDSRIKFSQELLQGEKTLPNKQEQQEVLKCCPECTTNYEKEAESLKSNQHRSSSCTSNDKGSNQLPSWLKPNDADPLLKEDLVELRRKWNRLCLTLHQGKQNQTHIASVFHNQCSIGKNQSQSPSYPWWPNQNSISDESKSISFAEPILKPIQSASSVPKFRRQQSCHIEFSFTNGNSKHRATVEPSLDSLKSRDDREVKITLALGNSVFSNVGANMAESDYKRAALNAGVCKILLDEVPWQSESIPSIVETLMMSSSKKDRWLLIEGDDIIGKRKLARGLAESIFGSTDLLLCISMRKTETLMSSFAELLENALRKHDKLVVLIEDVDLANAENLRYLAEGFGTGNLLVSQKNACDDAIFILTKAADTTPQNHVQEYTNSIIQMSLVISDMFNSSLQANADHHKRKADWELPNKSKSPRNDEMEIDSPFVAAGKGRTEISRQLSSNTLDLNIIAGEEEHIIEIKQEELSPISIESARENQMNPIGFLGQIKNRFLFNRDAAQDNKMKDTFLSNIRKSFEEVGGNKNPSQFSVEQTVLEELLFSSGSFLNSLFEKWLRDIFQTSLQKLDICRDNIISIRLCSAGKGESCGKDGFMGSCLPKGIRVSFLD